MSAQSKYICKAMVVWLLILATGCGKEDDVSKHDDYHGQPVLFAFLTADSVFSVHLSRSVSYESPDAFERVYDGYITVNRNGIRVDSFPYQPRYNRVIRNDISVRAGNTFDIMAGDSRGNIVYGSVTVPLVVPVKQIDTVRITYMGERYVDCGILFYDVYDEPNFYQLIVTEEEWNQTDDAVNYSQNTVNYQKIDSLFFIRDMEGSLLGNIDFKGSFSDANIGGGDYTLKIRIPSWYVNAPSARQKKRITFTLLSLTGDYYHYLRSRIIADYNYYLPVVDPIKIHTNINGGLGLVGGIAASSDSLVLVGSDWRDESCIKN